MWAPVAGEQAEAGHQEEFLEDQSWNVLDFPPPAASFSPNRGTFGDALKRDGTDILEVPPILGSHPLCFPGWLNWPSLVLSALPFSAFVIAVVVFYKCYVYVANFYLLYFVRCCRAEDTNLFMHFFFPNISTLPSFLPSQGISRQLMRDKAKQVLKYNQNTAN